MHDANQSNNTHSEIIMTQAKHLYGAGKSEAVRNSFQKKLEAMKFTLRAWKKAGIRDEKFWPDSLRSLKDWDSPAEGIHSWKSNNITQGDGDYADLVKSYWRLQEQAAKLPKPSNERGGSEPTRLKQEVVRLGQQISELTFGLMDLRDALVRVDPKNEALDRWSFA